MESDASIAITVIGIIAGVIVMAFIIGMIALAHKRRTIHKAGKWSDVLQLCLWSESILWSLLCKALGSCVVVAVQMNVS
jgi:hypothetical protein